MAEKLVMVQPLKLTEEEETYARPPFCASTGGERGWWLSATVAGPPITPCTGA